VNKVRWSEVPELYGQSPAAQVFSTRTTETGQTLVQFGDTLYGTVLPTGNANVTATYRFGLGVGGEVGANSLSTLLDRIQGLTSVANPLPAEGGAPETTDSIRQNASRTVRTFDRAVSLQDFQDFVTASGEVAKALAAWVWDGFAPAVHLTVAGQGGGTFSDLTLTSLGATLANARDPNHRLLLANYVQVPIQLSARVWVQPDYSVPEVLAAATQAVLVAFSFDQLDLGQSLHLSQVYSLLQNVAGVIAVDITRFGFRQPAGITDFRAYLISRGVTWLPDGTVAPVQDFLRIFSARPDPTQTGSVLPAEVAWIETASQDVTITAQRS
jgi:predicted phage baseplate assembly protein